MNERQLNGMTELAAALPLSQAKVKLLDRLRRGEINQTPATRHVIPRRFSSVAPLSFAQEQICAVMDAYPSAPPLYNESITIHRRGPLEISIVERCLAEILRRHEAWRSTFHSVDGNKFQVIHNPVEHLPISCSDLRHLPK